MTLREKLQATSLTLLVLVAGNAAIGGIYYSLSRLPSREVPPVCPGFLIVLGVLYSGMWMLAIINVWLGEYRTLKNPCPACEGKGGKYWKHGSNWMWHVCPECKGSRKASQ